MTGSMAALAALLYVVALFAIAYYGDTHGARFKGPRVRAAIYALSLAIYCTSWTFFGSVGLASTQGLDFLPIYIGPVLVLIFGQPLLLRVLRLAKSQNVTSVADFVAARYGKSGSVSAVVAAIAVIGAVPYIALQLRAVTASLLTVLGSPDTGRFASFTGPGAASVTLVAAALLAVFAMAFGTRKVDATEHQDGLMLAIAAESIVKLLAFLAVGAFVVWWEFDGFHALTARALADPAARVIIERPPDWANWAAMTLFSAFAILLLPRQFHVMIVENREARDLRAAAWLFPAYLVAINFFVLPLAVAGILSFPLGAFNGDVTLLALPMLADAPWITLIALIGGLSAATAMVIVSSVALSIMVSNALTTTLLVRGGLSQAQPRVEAGLYVLGLRRMVIVAVIGLAYVYARFAGEAQLAAIGLLSFGAVAQIGPAFLGGLFWRRGTAWGANAGMIAGAIVWAYTLLLPSLKGEFDVLASLVRDGPLGVASLRPTAMFGLDLPLIAHSALWSLSINLLIYVAVSYLRPANAIERLQANVFVGGDGAPMGQSFRIWRASTTTGELVSTVERYLGAERTRSSFEAFLASRGQTFEPTREADIHVVRFAEYLLSSAVGAASSRLVLSLLFRRGAVSPQAALKLLDEASTAIQHNRDLLQHALDHARQGITVFDRDLQLICWNREFRDLFDLPPDFLHVGAGLEQIVRFNAERGLYGAGDLNDFVAGRIESLVNDLEPFRLRLQSGGVIEIRSARMPDGWLVTTYTDVTESVEAEEALAAANESLEQRVRERTEQLLRLNAELARAKAEAEAANQSKTRFLAAASHDLLQPLNAARLYAASLNERAAQSESGQAALARNVDASLEAVEEILTSILDISRLDAGALKPHISRFDIADLLRQLEIEFAPIARAKGLALEFRIAPAGVRSDRRLLRRLLQNLISNAIKYTPIGTVRVVCKPKGGAVRIGVWDTGMGIPREKRHEIFQEFRRLDAGARAARGLGLGLSIVERIARVLNHQIRLRSIEGRGSLFLLRAPRAADSLPAPAEQQAAPAPMRALSGLTLIAIDNEPRILEGLSMLLTGWGCEVFVARSLDEALAVLPAGRRVGGVIADFHLDEGRTGLEAITELRRRLGETPAVLATADRTQELRQIAHAADIAVLDKPLKPAALRALLAQWRMLSVAD